MLLVQEFRTDRTDDAEDAHNGQVLDDFLLRLIGPDQDRWTNADATGWITRSHVVAGDGEKMPGALPVAFAKLTRSIRATPEAAPLSLLGGVVGASLSFGWGGAP